jgi:hypothetical protein
VVCSQPLLPYLLRFQVNQSIQMVLLTRAMYAALLSKKHPKPRGCVYPDMEVVQNPRNADLIEKVQVGDKKVEKVTWGAVEIPPGFELKGVMDHGDACFTNVGPDVMEIENKGADGAKVKSDAKCGARVFAFFEGAFFSLFIPKTEFRPASMHYFFDRQSLSHFCL